MVDATRGELAQGGDEMNANELTKKLITTLAVLPAIIEDWGICATPYEQKKHNLSGDIAMAKSAVDEAETIPICD